MLKHEVGYYIGDILGDEEEEMVIGSGNVLFEVYTMKDGRVQELVHSGYNVQDHILSTGKLLKYTSIGGGNWTYSLFSLTDKGYKKLEAHYFYDSEYDYDYEQGLSRNCWFKSSNKNDWKGTASTLVSTSEAEAWVAARESEVLKFDFTPLALYETGLTDKNYGVISVKGKTTGSSTVNIRKKPDKNSGKVTKAKVGTYVEILGTEGDYYQIVINGKEGYVQKDFLTVCKYDEGSAT